LKPSSQPVKNVEKTGTNESPKTFVEKQNEGTKSFIDRQTGEIPKPYVEKQMNVEKQNEGPKSFIDRQTGEIPKPYVDNKTNENPKKMKLNPQGNTGGTNNNTRKTGKGNQQTNEEDDTDENTKQEMNKEIQKNQTGNTKLNNSQSKTQQQDGKIQNQQNPKTVKDTSRNTPPPSNIENTRELRENEMEKINTPPEKETPEGYVPLNQYSQELILNLINQVNILTSTLSQVSSHIKSIENNNGSLIQYTQLLSHQNQSQSEKINQLAMGIKNLSDLIIPLNQIPQGRERKTNN